MNTTPAAEPATEPAATAKLYELIERQVVQLNEALGLDPKDYTNRVSFGYLGNCGHGFDDRWWQVFLPHPGRVGTYADSLGGFKTDDEDGMRNLSTQLTGAIALARWQRDR